MSPGRYHAGFNRILGTPCHKIGEGGRRPRQERAQRDDVLAPPAHLAPAWGQGYGAMALLCRGEPGIRQGD